MDKIYQDIWNADQVGNGVPALRPGEVKSKDVGYVVVDERSVEVGSDHKVLVDVEIPESKLETYRLCERMFDNYALERVSTEIIRPQETQEELDFIDAILDTPPIQVAREHMERSLGLNISNQILAAMIRETWFTFGSSGSQRYASGFEHVFVGEQASQRTKIGGYHFWYKYYLDDGGRTSNIGDGVDRIEYRGTKYGGAQEPGKGILVPEVVTLSLIWEAPAGDGGGSQILDKPIGGFFVGPSPEGLIAMGLVRARTQSGKEAKINGATYDLDLHRLDGAPNTIRTFFPRFKNADVVSEDIQKPENVGGEVAPSEATAYFRIIAAMVNPENPEGGNEFLQIINTNAKQQSLSGWRVVAPNGLSFELSDIQVAPGDVFKFQIPKNEGVLRNKDGEIWLVNAAGDIVQVCSYTSEQAANEGSPILFS